MKRFFLLYGLSGLVGVAYEVLWVRLLSQQFGVSVLGVVITVSAFMLGLGLGSLAMARAVTRMTQPLRLLALLEALLALFAWFLPTGLRVLNPTIDHAAAILDATSWHWLMGAAAFVILTGPALLMGAGFPLALRAAGNRPPQLGLLYGFNTLGAVLGALLPLALLPVLGWGLSLRGVAFLGLLLAIAFALSSKSLTTLSENPDPVVTPPVFLLITYGALGAASLMMEVAWTRLLGLVLLRTEYVLALILAVFLMGISLGSLIVARWGQPRWLRIMPWWVAGFTLLSLWAMPALSAWAEQSHFNSFAQALVMQGLAILLLTLPVTLALGAWLPLLSQHSRSSGMMLYGANSLGAAAGAALAGFVCIPLLGSTGTLMMAALLALILGCYWSGARWQWLGVPVVAWAALLLSPMPSVSSLMPMQMSGSHDVYHYEDAIALTTVVEQADGQRVLLTDLQRRDASTDPTAVFVQGNQARLPLLLHPDPRSILFLGLGTGISVAGSKPFPHLERTAVELSAGAIQSAQYWFAPFNETVLKNTRLQQDDARHFLSANAQCYDVVVGDLFHPDLAGVSSLLSVQQFQRARAHLNRDGLFVQWLALNQFDETSLAVVLRSFKHVFPEGQLFLDGLHLALVGPAGQWLGASSIAAHMVRLGDEAQQNEATAGEGEATWLGRYWGPIPDSAGLLQDEWAPVIEFQLPRLRYGAGPHLQTVLQHLLQQRPRVEAAATLLQVPAEERQSFERAYIATELLVRSELINLGNLGVRPHAGSDPKTAKTVNANFDADKLIGMAHEANPRDRWAAYALADRLMDNLGGATAQGLTEEQALQKVLVINPWQVEAVRQQWHVQRAAGNPQAETTRARLRQLSPLDREALSAKN
jgi:spermidine synthase